MRAVGEAGETLPGLPRRLVRAPEHVVERPALPDGLAQADGRAVIEGDGTRVDWSRFTGLVSESG